MRHQSAGRGTPTGGSENVSIDVSIEREPRPERMCSTTLNVSTIRGSGVKLRWKKIGLIKLSVESGSNPYGEFILRDDDDQIVLTR